MSDAPKRIQYKRGQTLPAGAKLVARPSRWGNPYRLHEYSRPNAVELYRLCVVEIMPEPELRAWLEPLRGATALACYCPPGELCHADVLIEYLQKTEEA